MAKIPKVATINLGMQTVTMAVFEATADGGIRLEAFATEDLAGDPSTDASREGQLKIALTELTSKVQWAGKEASCAVPSQGVFARFVSIPKVEGDQIGKMLYFEAQQNVPYPIEDVSWGYQILPENDEAKLGALLLATKLEQLDVAINALRTSGLTPDHIDTSPVALYNALRYNYPELQGSTLLIDIGARTTNLIFSEGERLFIRTLPVGGSTITGAMLKRFEGRAFRQVEEFKCAKGFIPPPGNFSGSSSAEADEAGKIARTVMTRIHNEITRSITYYRTTQHGSTPVRVLLSGGGVSMPYTLEFFNEKLSLPIEFFNPLRRVAISSSVDAQTLKTFAHRLGECTGLALRSLVGNVPLEINLESPTLVAEKRAAARYIPLAVIAALLVAGIGLTGLYYSRATQRIMAINEDMVARTEKLRQFETALNKVAADKKAQLTAAADIAAAPVLREAWATILNQINADLPERNIWVTKLLPVAGDQVLEPGDEKSGWKTAGAAHKTGVTALEITGLYLASEEGPAVIDRYVEKLAQSPFFAITLANKTSVVQLRATPSGDKWAYDFKLKLPLARPIPL